MNKFKMLPALIVCAAAAIWFFFRNNGNSQMLNVYTSVPLDIAEELVREFEKEHPKIKIALRRVGTVEIVDEVVKEFESGAPRADVLWLADRTSAEELKARGFLSKYVSPHSARIHDIFKDGGGYYTGSRLLNMVVVFNTELVKNRPQGYNDLLDPDLKGKIAIADPARSGSIKYAIASLLLDKNFAWPYFVQLYRNKCRIVHDNTGLTRMIAGGEICMGISIDFTVRKLLKENPGLPLDYVYPEDGVVAVVSPIAVTMGSAHKAAAEKFVDWSLSAGTQRLLSGKMGITPLRNDVPVPEGMPPLNELKILPSNPRLILKTASQCDRIFNDIFSGKPLDDINTGLLPPEDVPQAGLR